MLSSLDAWIDDRALPTWARIGVDAASGLFRERLSWDGSALLVPHRAMVQARQIYVFAHAASLGLVPEAHDPADRAMHRLRRSFAQTSGGETSFIFSIDPVSREPHSRTLDSYTHAFVLLATSYLYRLTGDPALVTLADEVTLFVERRLSDRRVGGVVDSLPAPSPPTKRQNPQMHLLEAYLALEQAMPGRGYLDRAAPLVRLFREHLIDREAGVLLEYFAADWSAHPDPARARLFEPGHHYEWIWLLDRYERLSGADLSREREALWRSAQAHGHAGSGLVYDEIAADGQVVSGGHRLWPHTEAIKAAATRHREGDTNARAFADRMAQSLLDTFLDRPFEGGWIDHVEPDLTQRVDYVPASSLYHLFLAAAEARATFGAGEGQAATRASFSPE